MPDGSYVRRALDFTIQLGEGSYGGSGFNTLELKGLRATVQIELATSAPPIALIRLFGLTLDQINQLTTTGLAWQSRDNNIIVSAGEAGGTMTTIFNGTIFRAYPDMNSMPNVSFVIFGNAGRTLQMKPVAPSSFPNGVEGATIMGSLAQQAGLKLENNGVSAMIRDSYLPGTLWSKISAVADAANCYFHIDRTAGVLAIWPKTSARSSDIPLISPQTCLVGYPEYEQAGIKVRTLFHGEGLNIKFGGKVKVESQLKAANGTWSVVSLSYDLASEMPNGPWLVTFSAVRQTQ